MWFLLLKSLFTYLCVQVGPVAQWTKVRTSLSFPHRFLSQRSAAFHLHEVDQTATLDAHIESVNSAEGPL